MSVLRQGFLARSGRAAVLLFAILLTDHPAGLAAGQLVEGPWFNARVGTRIVYRVSTPSPLPGGKAAVRTIAEEAIAVSETEVTLRIVRKSAGRPDEVSTRKVPRRIGSEEYTALFHGFGFVRPSPAMTVSGHAFDCSAFVKDIEVPGGEPVRRYTTVCRRLPGWIFHSSVGLSTGSEELHQILEYKP